MKEGVMEEGAISRDGMAVVGRLTLQAPRMVPRVDYERIFVLGEDARLLGEYALRDDCPLEYDDLRRSIPVNGMRHLVAFYQGEYAFTPFRVEDLWFVVLTHGVPRIEERGSIGTLLAAMRMHLPPSLSPAIAAREDALQERDREAEAREAQLRRREQRLALLEAELRTAAITLRDLEGEVRTRETRLTALRDYALQMQRAFRQPKPKAEHPVEAEPTMRRASSGPPPP
ncbi:MAG: hypothetical protein E6J92_02375 [Methanobacteriota archaeon]|nr:MAG: hypothetical protein E6J96_04230 [Euryarchaeota archaeon]TMA03242.1 MAG: hypothetical protein E6J92_02375 [Euryarchaeota archaeon]